MLVFESSGSFSKTENFFEKMKRGEIIRVLKNYGQLGVEALSAATPKDSGLAASSWSYKVSGSRGAYAISWSNSDVENGFPVVIMLQYGHGTRGGGWVQGRDFINPALKPIFDKIADDVWKVVTSA